MSHASQAGRTRVKGRAVTPVQAASYLIGAVFAVVAVLGFIPGVTTDYGAMRWAGHESGAELFGVFQVSVLHNLVHGVLGILGLALGRTVATARGFLVGGGLIYLALWLYGLFVDEGSGANFVPLNDADDWLHLGLAVAMIALGLALPPHRTAPPGRHAPGQHAPGQRTPGQHAPGRHALGQHAPGQHAPGQHTPGQHAPGRHTAGRRATGTHRRTES